MTITKKDVAAYFAALVNASPKTQEEIAREVGLESANTISMLKSGKSPIPLARIPALARALDADPHQLFAKALEAYQPDIYKVFAALAPSMLISSKELQLVRALRAAARSKILS